jgi:hypothetical protein
MVVSCQYILSFLGIGCVNMQCIYTQISFSLQTKIINMTMFIKVMVLQYVLTSIYAEIQIFPLPLYHDDDHHPFSNVSTPLCFIHVSTFSLLNMCISCHFVSPHCLWFLLLFHTFYMVIILDIVNCLKYIWTVPS